MLLRKMSVIHYDVERLIVIKETEPEKLLTINPVLRMLINGVCDEDCPLSVFKGLPHILNVIWSLVMNWWKKLIQNGVTIGPLSNPAHVAFTKLNTHVNSPLTFPEPRDLYLNMMPFVMEKTFEKCKLPKYLKPYWEEFINKEYYVGFRFRKLIPESEYGKIGYLTIHESYVDESKTQRRAGLHTDCPGKLMICTNKHGDNVCVGKTDNDSGSFWDLDEDRACALEGNIGNGLVKDSFTHPWGGGFSKSYGHELDGGIYMISDVSNSCEVWNCRILQGEKGDEIIGYLGDVEHLREFLPEHETMLPNKMYWLTDRTPHQSLPLKVGRYRQYFRLVTSQVSIWFEEHSTKNPKGVTPDPNITKVVKGSKFEANWNLLLDLKINSMPPGKQDRKKRKELKEKKKELKKLMAK